jgi:putative acetyltransferase
MARRDVVVRPIEARDDAGVEHVIRTVMTEFGAVGSGFAIEDAEVPAMHAAYQAEHCAFFVAEHDGAVIGGAGIAPLAGGSPDVCELRKMYLLPAGRGLGLGSRLLETCLDAAREHGFRTCYLETLAHMSAARRLYERYGFEPTGGPWGATGHCGCDSWYARAL